MAIRIFKAQFLSILAGVADNFPMQLWDKLLPQAEFTINLLRQSNATPTISAYAHPNGLFDYTKCNWHQWDAIAGAWKIRLVWHMGFPRCRRLVPQQIEQFSNTVEFQHKRTTNPTALPADKIMQAISSCITTFQGLPAFKSNDDLQHFIPCYKTLRTIHKSLRM